LNLLGIDSVRRPYDDRVAAWNRLAQDLPMIKLESMIREVGLEELPELGRAILKGQVQGRVLVDPHL
jgi:acrylyl-CoA reductase (NADPH)